jgi:hypothetical protein
MAHMKDRSERKAELHLGQVEEALGGLRLRGQTDPSYCSSQWRFPDNTSRDTLFRDLNGVTGHGTSMAL